MKHSRFTITSFQSTKSSDQFCISHNAKMSAVAAPVVFKFFAFPVSRPAGSRYCPILLSNFLNFVSKTYLLRITCPLTVEGRRSPLLKMLGSGATARGSEVPDLIDAARGGEPSESVGAPDGRRRRGGRGSVVDVSEGEWEGGGSAGD